MQRSGRLRGAIALRTAVGESRVSSHRRAVTAPTKIHCPPVACAGSVVIFSAMKFLHLNFLPRSTDLALLLLRVWYGASLVFLHGWDKLINFSSRSSGFVDPFGIGRPSSLVLAIGGEVVCAAFLVLGLFTRFAAIGSGVTMGVAFWLIHGTKLRGDNNGELAFLYLGVFVALFIAGAGRFSLDARMGAKT
jgi:putative oxidoreductase